MTKRGVDQWRPLDDRPALGPMFDDAELHRWAGRRRHSDAHVHHVLMRAWRPWLDQIIEATGLPLPDSHVEYRQLGQVARYMPRRTALCLALRDAVKVFVEHRAQYGYPTPKMEAGDFEKIEVTARHLIEALGCNPEAPRPSFPQRPASMPRPSGRSLLGALATADPEVGTEEAPGTVPFVVRSGLVDAATEDAKAWGGDIPEHEADRSVREAIAAVKALNRWAALAGGRAAALPSDGSARDDPALDDWLCDLGDAYRDAFAREPAANPRPNTSLRRGGPLNVVDGPFVRFAVEAGRLMASWHPSLSDLQMTPDGVHQRWRRIKARTRVTSPPE